jgi:threonine dehydrogenase-like Zn-dependent dehydrogenase
MLHVLTPSPHDTICIVGAGAVGLAALMSLNFQERKPKQIIVVDVIDERLKMAVKYGATHTVNSRNEKDLKAALKELTKEKGIDRAIDTTGRPDIVGDLLESTAKRGLVCSVGVGAVSCSSWFCCKVDSEETNDDEARCGGEDEYLQYGEFGESLHRMLYGELLSAGVFTETHSRVEGWEISVYGFDEEV